MNLVAFVDCERTLKIMILVRLFQIAVSFLAAMVTRPDYFPMAIAYDHPYKIIAFKVAVFILVILLLQIPISIIIRISRLFSRKKE